MKGMPIKCGFVPLVDSAPLIVANELSFAADEGIKLDLQRQPSWAALRDLLASGHLDVAHMLSPMPIAMALGLSGVSAQIHAPMMLSVNGNVVGVSSAHAEVMRSQGWLGRFDDPIGSARALLSGLKGPLRVGIPFPHSMHRLLFEYWLNAASGNAPSAVELITIPPPLMAEKVASGEIDAFCVGEPWGTVAVESGVGEIVLPGTSIWAFSPEKVLGVREDVIEAREDEVGALMRAIYRAARWLDTPGNHILASEILARSDHLNIPDQAIDRALSGNILPSLVGQPIHVSNFLRFHRAAATFPWRSQAAWIAAQTAKTHHVPEEKAIAVAERIMRPDLYRAHLAPLGVDMPGASSKVEGAMSHRMAVASTAGNMILGPDAFFDGAVFDFSR